MTGKKLITDYPGNHIFFLANETVLFGFFKDKLRLTSGGSLAAIIGGGSVGLVSKLPTLVNVSHVPVLDSLVAIKHLDLWAFAVSLLLLFGVSYATHLLARKQPVDVAGAREALDDGEAI